MNNYKTDFLICGGGIIGLTIARELLKREADITIIEKEENLGRHASGRNSGVLHSGIYYARDSLKARSCLRGNFLMKNYCKEKGLPLLETGKVIVARNEGETKTLGGLYDRAVENGAKVDIIDEKQLEEIEPNAKTCGIALYSYFTAVVDPRIILNSLSNDLTSSKKVRILTGTAFHGVKGNSIVLTNKGEIRFNTFINAAGAYSDRVAKHFNIGANYHLIPFKGIYKKLRPEKSCKINGSIYPVPDMRNPFLGVHFTKNTNGEVYIGPTAIPAMGRENYGFVNGIGMESFNIIFKDMLLFCASPKFREVALTEPMKYVPRLFFRDALSICKNIHPDDIIPSDKVGIRPQLVDWEKKELVMDYLILKDGNSIHLLNTISPAFTSSMYFAEFLVDRYILDGNNPSKVGEL